MPKVKLYFALFFAGPQIAPIWAGGRKDLHKLLYINDLWKPGGPKPLTLKDLGTKT
jgi:hypothetical protein